jgi:hypothetical protein
MCYVASDSKYNEKIFLADASELIYESLPTNFRNLWKTMLYFLYQNKVIPFLVEKLIHKSSSEDESHHRCKVAALWVKELLQSLYKVKKTVELVQNLERERHHGKEAQKVRVYKIFKRKSKRKLKIKLTASHIHNRMVKEVEKLNPNLKEVISLRIQKLPSRMSELQLLQKAILKPSPCTRIFLPWYVLVSFQPFILEHAVSRVYVRVLSCGM